ncbi:hypothetical protein N0V82_009015 [Gnomoniopsis sp. IMI 355080]|nr:hypothetical protein N0V82_009015 [Gnomoniopsis sp. IMI 355080]
MDDPYQINLAGLLGLCGVLLVAQRYSSKETPVDKSTESKKKTIKDKAIESAEASQWPFLTVFALVMGSDWLQGPFLYSLYREEHGVSSALVSTLFTTGFISGALSAYVTGTLADAHGRKRACLFFCAAYALSCVLTTIPSLPLLFLGRILGGISTSLLFSVFESWMVTDFHARKLASKGGDLSRTFGLMSTLNSVVAIVSGVFSEWVVSVAGTRKAPFVAAALLLGAASWVIATRWEENYGDSAASQKKKTDQSGENTNKPKLWNMLKDPRIVCLGLASTMFEGSMYLFVFFWGPALTSARKYEAASGAAPKGSSGGLPYGIIFASFMASVLAASLVFNIAMDRKLLKYTYLLLGILGVADLVFYLLEQPRSEQTSFWLFCLFEACVGMYWPCMGYLKGQLIEDGLRAQLYSILRVPLNVFVVVSLYFTGDGDAYGKVFAVCSRLLLAAIGALYAMAMNEEELP